jgi:serine/threonine-protein kinase
MSVKRCPRCNRVYGDETLRFCLDDGSPLSDGHGSRDSEATLVNPPPQGSPLPPTEAWQYLPQPTQAAPPRHNPVLAYAFIAVVAFLGLLVGGGIVFLLKSAGKADSDTAGTSSPSPSPSPLQQDTRRAVPSPSRDNPGMFSSTSNYDAVESRLLRGESIGMSDLGGMSADELRRLRNTVYARHGRMFNTPELQRYFDSRPWYTRRLDYGEQDLTSVDKRNLNVIMAAEKGAG